MNKNAQTYQLLKQQILHFHPIDLTILDTKFLLNYKQDETLAEASCRCGNVEALIVLKQNNLLTTCSEMKLLMIAAEYGHVSCIKLLLNQLGIQCRGHTALMYAVENNRVDATLFLLKFKQEIANSDMRICLFGAIKKDSLDTIKLITNYVSQDVIYHLLKVAVHKHQILEFLISQLTDKSQREEDQTALSEAARTGDIESIRMLLFEVGRQNEDGTTALMQAIIEKQHEACCILSKYSSETICRNQTTALMLAVETCDIRIIKLFEYQLGKQNNQGEFVLLFCNFKFLRDDGFEQQQFIKKMIEKERNLVTNTGLTPLMAFSRTEHADIFINQAGKQDVSGYTALIHLARIDNLQQYDLYMYDNDTYLKQMLNKLVEAEAGILDNEKLCALDHLINTAIQENDFKNVVKTQAFQLICEKEVHLVEPSDSAFKVISTMSISDMKKFTVKLHCAEQWQQFFYYLSQSNPKAVLSFEQRKYTKINDQLFKLISNNIKELQKFDINILYAHQTVQMKKQLLTLISQLIQQKKMKVESLSNFTLRDYRDLFNKNQQQNIFGRIKKRQNKLEQASLLQWSDLQVNVWSKISTSEESEFEDSEEED